MTTTHIYIYADIWIKLKKRKKERKNKTISTSYELSLLRTLFVCGFFKYKYLFPIHFMINILIVDEHINQFLGNVISRTQRVPIQRPLFYESFHIFTILQDS